MGIDFCVQPLALTSVDDYSLRLDDDRDTTCNGDGMTTLLSNN